VDRAIGSVAKMAAEMIRGSLAQPALAAQMRTAHDLARLLFRIGGVWIVIGSGDNLAGIVSQSVDMFRGNGQTSLMWWSGIPYCVALVTAYVLWARSNWLAGEAVGPIPDEGSKTGAGLGSVSETAVLQVVGICVLVGTVPGLTNAISSGIGEWEYIDRTGLSYESVSGFQSPEYWVQFAGIWAQYAFSLTIGSWLVLGVPRLSHIVRNLRVAGAYSESRDKDLYS
jgi:hypothetical protein